MKRRLTLRTVQKSKPGWRCDGGGLYLESTRAKDGSVNRSWVFRYQRGGDHWMGLGPFPDVSLEEARAKAAAQRQLLRDGVDPIATRNAQRAAAQAQELKRTTFLATVESYLAFKESEWKSAKHAAQWRMTLVHYTQPLHELDPATIDLPLVVSVLKPLWDRAPETGSRLRQRIEGALDHWAVAHGIPGYVNPAAWERVQHVLPSPTKLKKKNNGGTDAHHAAMPYDQLPQFMSRLRARPEAGARALELAILTAARTSEVLGLEWGEIDWEAKIWVVPATRMKMRREHRVPLCDRAVALLRELDQSRAPFALGNRAMARVVERLCPDTDATVHGFRAAFKTWATERTSYPREMIEVALAHNIGEKQEAAYLRGDMIEKRRRLMETWAAHCARPTATGDNVVSLATAQ